jgi:hypothetical protein
MISIAGLWVLCCVQNQARPHHYISYSTNISTEQTLHTAPVNASFNGGATLNRVWPSSVFTIVLAEGSPSVAIKQSFYLDVVRSEFQPKLYRIFPTGLSPPRLSVNFS